MKTTSKRTLEVIIATAMSVSLLPSNLVFAEGTYKSWTEAAENAVQGVDFTVEDGINYKVYTAAGLAYTANIVNNVDTDINITIENDIDLSTAGVIGYGSDVNEENSWIPIGKSGNEYTGTFEGNGNKIYNLYITTSESVYAGLFGYVEDVGCVNKINIASGSIINEANDGYAGGIAGKNDGMITECTNSSSVSGKYAGGIVGKTFKSITSGIEEKITYCVNNGNVIGSNAGGIVGYADEQSIIDNCINNGQILGAGGDNDMVGGIVGNNAGASGYRSIIKNCTNTSNVANSENYVGGIAGSTAYTDIINCVNSGTIDGAYTAGIVGFHTSDSNIKNCVNSGDVIGSFQVGIVCVVFPGANVKNCYYLNGSAGSAVSVNILEP